jgi:UDP:flavonoid glycosyltransferase YjiC (YdhE family)
MVSIGSWGDAEPYVAFTKELIERNHSVDLFLQPEFHERIHQTFFESGSGSTSNFRLHALPFDSKDFYKVIPAQTQRDVDPKLKYVEVVGEIIGQLVLPSLDQIYDIAKACQAIVSCAFGRCLCIAIAKALNLPMIILHLQPLAPNRVYPSYRISRQAFVKAVIDFEKKNVATANYDETLEETYWIIEEALERTFLKSRVSQVYQKIGIDPLHWSELKDILRGNNSQFFILNAYSNHLIPRIANTPGVGPNVYDIGPLADAYLPPSFQPDPALTSFLQMCDYPPICIGFGSMPFHRVSVIVSALIQLERKAIFVGKSLSLSNCPPKYQEFVNTMIFQASFVPYSYLLPFCDLMLCHGGAGVVHACLRAGIPCIVSPIMGDQFLFASLLQAKGLGLQCGSKLSELTVTNVLETIQTVQDKTDIIAKNCKMLGKQIRHESISGKVGLGLLESLLIQVTSEGE